MHFPGIVLLCVFAAVAYGVAHDMVTARVCVEYFTIGHPPIFGTDDPTILALGWGFLATWWVGAILGIALAIAAREGSRPPRTIASLVRPVVLLMLVTGVCAVVAGVIGWATAGRGGMVLLPPLHAAHDLPPEKQAAFLADLWAHNASYLVGFVGGLVVCVRVWRSRDRSPDAVAHAARTRHDVTA
jgi:hypothetical protein